MLASLMPTLWLELNLTLIVTLTLLVPLKRIIPSRNSKTMKLTFFQWRSPQDHRNNAMFTNTLYHHHHTTTVLRPPFSGTTQINYTDGLGLYCSKQLETTISSFLWKNHCISSLRYWTELAYWLQPGEDHPLVFRYNKPLTQAVSHHASTLSVPPMAKTKSSSKFFLGRPNNIRGGLKCPSVCTYVHKKFSRFQWNFVCRHEQCMTVCHMTQSKVIFTGLLKFRKLHFSRSLSSTIYNGSWQVTTNS